MLSATIQTVREISNFPEFAPGQACVRLHETTDGHLLITGIHGSLEGFLSMVVFIEDNHGEINYTLKADTDPSELRELARGWGWDGEGSLIIAPCYPLQVAQRYQGDDRLVVLGDWSVPTTGGWWLEDEQRYTARPYPEAA